MNDPIFRRRDSVWLNEPEQWTAEGDSLEIVTDNATDFWRKTHYGFNRDSGHFLGFPASEAFTGLRRLPSASLSEVSPRPCRGPSRALLA